MKYCLENYLVVASEELKDELLRHLKRKTRVPYRWLRHFRLSFEEKCLVVSVDASETDAELRDPDDMHVLQAAKAESCEVIVTGDKDLLELDSHKGIPIITPAEFIGAL